MKVFVAGSYTAIKQAREVAEFIRSLGHEVTSHWLNEPFDHFDGEDDWRRMAVALIDAHDIKRSDAFVVLTTTPSSTGGFHAEIGMALAWDIPIYVLGPRDNVYLHTPGIKDFEDFDRGEYYGVKPSLGMWWMVQDENDEDA